MTSQNPLIPTGGDSLEVDQLLEAIQEAQQALLAAEAELAEEQAAVNAFRMHCRLKLDRWIDRLMELQAERQSLRTRLELQRQAGGSGTSFGRDDPFWKEADRVGDEPPAQEEELLLPTDVPRDKAAEKRLYRELARRFHPDLGQTALEIAYRTEMMAAVNKAYAAADNQALYDLAGQLDPQAAAALAAIPSPEIRRLKRQLVRLQQRQRRARQRLVISREENTARLWRKAQRLERDDTHWWEVVRREIERAIGRLEEEVAELSELLAVLSTEEEQDPQAA